MNLTGLKRQRKALAVIKTKIKNRPEKSYNTLQEIEQKSRRLEKEINSERLKYKKRKSKKK